MYMQNLKAGNVIKAPFGWVAAFPENTPQDSANIVYELRDCSGMLFRNAMAQAKGKTEPTKDMLFKAMAEILRDNDVCNLHNRNLVLLRDPEPALMSNGSAGFDFHLGLLDGHMHWQNGANMMLRAHSHSYIQNPDLVRDKQKQPLILTDQHGFELRPG